MYEMFIWWIHVISCHFIDPSLATQTSCPSEVTTSTACSTEAATATSQPSRSHSVPLNRRVELDSADSIHVLGVAYMYMREDGHLDFLPANANPDGDDRGTFKLVTVLLLELNFF